MSKHEVKNNNDKIMEFIINNDGEKFDKNQENWKIKNELSYKNYVS